MSYMEVPLSEQPAALLDCPFLPEPPVSGKNYYSLTANVAHCSLYVSMKCNFADNPWCFKRKPHPCPFVEFP